MMNRRSFLKTVGAAVAGGALAPWLTARAQVPGPGTGFGPWDFAPDLQLARIAWPWGVTIHNRPRPEGKVVRTVYPEELVVIRRQVVGVGFMPHNHRWFETDDGYLYVPHAVPVRNITHTPLSALPAEGFVWAELSVPFTEGRASADPAARSLYRLYYGAVYQVTQIVTGADGQVWYRAGTEVIPNMYAPAAYFRIVQPNELTPISPNVNDKSLVVNLTRQTITAYEGRAEVFRAQIASGAQFFGADGKTLTGGTGQGQKFLWSKRISRQMQGGTRESGWDLPGVAWVGYYASNGEALHAAYWHNDFGRPKSRGCINLRPDDAKWLFRWTNPSVTYYPGNLIVNWENRGTLVDIRAE